MKLQELIEQGNQYRNSGHPQLALKCYAQAFVHDPDCAPAFNNYGNVMREMGHPRRGIPFLEHAYQLNRQNVTAEFNLAVAHLLAGNYQQGWELYESRWRYEHLAGSKPQLPRPEWQGQDLKGKTILVIGEQGLGDQIQFSRFLYELSERGAAIKLHVSEPLKPLFNSDNRKVLQVTSGQDDIGDCDYWIPIMSLPRVLGITLSNLRQDLHYIQADPEKIKKWEQLLGKKTRMRVGFAWSGRRDSWINQHKAMPLDLMQDLISRSPNHEWISLQVDADADDQQRIAPLVQTFPGAVQNMADTAGLLHHMDLVISVDTAVAHLSGAMGRSTWIPLNLYGNCWRWGVERSDCAWYPSTRLFRQHSYGDWSQVLDKITQYLSWFKV
jgi:tetratricopeptide (TPR) repeat protein